MVLDIYIQLVQQFQKINLPSMVTTNGANLLSLVSIE